MTQDRPTLASVLKQAMDAHVADLHTAMPGIVQSYDASTQMCEVQPALKRKYKAEDQPTQLPIIQNVPVCWPRTANAGIHLPLTKGDIVLLVFAERSIDKWVTEGGISDPATNRKHDLSDAIAIPGVWPSSSALKLDSGDEDKIVLQIGTSKITLDKSGNIRIGTKGSTQTEPLVLGNVMASFVEALVDLLKTVPAGITTGPGSLIAPNPAYGAALDAVVLQYVTTATTSFLSKRYFTERGS